MAIWLDLNPRSGVPLYLQLIEQTRHALTTGILQPGEALPTVRELAKSLRVAPNTISKAYGELEAEGLIISRAGAGTIVNPALAGMLRHQARASIRTRLSQLVRDATALEIGVAELREWFNKELQQVDEESAGATPIKKEIHQNE